MKFLRFDSLGTRLYCGVGFARILLFLRAFGQGAQFRMRAEGRENVVVACGCCALGVSFGSGRTLRRVRTEKGGKKTFRRRAEARQFRRQKKPAHSGDFLGVVNRRVRKNARHGRHCRRHGRLHRPAKRAVYGFAYGSPHVHGRVVRSFPVVLLRAFQVFVAVEKIPRRARPRSGERVFRRVCCAERTRNGACRGASQGVRDMPARKVGFDCRRHRQIQFGDYRAELGGLENLARQEPRRLACAHKPHADRKGGVGAVERFGEVARRAFDGVQKRRCVETADCGLRFCGGCGAFAFRVAAGGAVGGALGAQNAQARGSCGVARHSGRARIFRNHSAQNIGVCGNRHRHRETA